MLASLLLYLSFVAFHLNGAFADGSAPLNLDVLMSTYLGGGTEVAINVITDVALDQNGKTYVTGSGPFNYGLSGQQVAGSGNGFVLTISRTLKAESIYRLGQTVNAIRIRSIHVDGSLPVGKRFISDTQGKDAVLLQGDFGIQVHDGSIGNIAWSKSMDCSHQYCMSDIGSDGQVAVLNIHGKLLKTFSPTGIETGSMPVGTRSGHSPQDVAIDPVNKRVVYAKFFQSYPHHVPVQIPCLIAYEYALQMPVWTDYCVGGDEDYNTQNMADSRVQHLYYDDATHKLYLSGYTDGGNSIFRYDPLAIANNGGHLAGLQMMNNTQKPHYDRYTDTYGMHGAKSINFVGRINPDNGGMEVGEFFLTRLANNDGNSLTGKDIAVGADGDVFVAQTAASSIEHRDNITINGQAVSDYAGGEAVLLGLPKAFDRRLVWHHFHTNPGHSDAIAVSARAVGDKSLVAFLAKAQKSEADFVNVNPLAGTARATGTTHDQFVLIVLEI